MAIPQGTAGPGGARFGAGAGGSNRFDHTAQGAGLWSIGIDPNAPDVDAQVQRWFSSQPAAVQADVRRGLASNGNSLTRAADWRGRDVARKIQKENGIFDVGIGKILGDIAPYAAAFLPGGQFLAPAIGATVGGVRDGLGGALLGGATGYMAGQAAPGISSMWQGAGGASTLLKAPGTFASNLGRDALTKLQGVVPGYGGNAAAALGKTAAKLAVNTGRAAVGAAGGGTGGSMRDQLIAGGPQLVGAALSAGSGDGSDAYDKMLLDARNQNSATQAMRASGVQSANNAFANQDDFYNRLRGSVFDYHKGDLDRDMADESRRLKFEMIRRGHLGGSQEVDATGDLQRLYNEGLLQAGGIADSARNQARAGDQSARAQAIRDITLDVDSGTAINSAINQSQLAGQQAFDQARGQNLGDTFSRLSYLYDQGQQKRGRAAAVRDYSAMRGGSGVGPASNSSGTVYNRVG